MTGNRSSGFAMASCSAMRAISSRPAAWVAARTAYIVAAVRERAVRGPSVRVCARKTAAVTSPPPRTVIGSSGVDTSHRPSGDEHSIWISPSGVSAVSTLVTSTVDGPIRCSCSTAATTSSSVVIGRPVRNSSSNWLGVTMSAAGTTWSRMYSGMPGRTKKPRPTSPMTGSQQ